MTRSNEAIAAAAAIGFAALMAASAVAFAAPAFADHVYENGYLYTLDANDSVRSALAVRAGVIVFVGEDAGALRWIGPRTEVEDLHGRMLMPGLVDGHMHPLAGGYSLLGCDLKYERLTVEQVLARIQRCLDASRDREPEGWLQVRNWFQEAMVGGGVMNRRMLDALSTRRPILVLSSFGHTALLNTKALELAHITSATPNPRGGEIGQDASGQPTGILQDGAIALAQRAVPATTPAEDVEAAESALAALSAQGITTFLDAAASPQTLAAFAGAEKHGKLTSRAHFAVLVQPAQAADPQKAVAYIRALAHRYDEGPIGPRPHLTVRNFKMFLDGVITAPALTGAMLEPYFANVATPEQPRWVPGRSRGPAVYFPPGELRRLVLAAAAAGLEPHMHADGDGAVHAALDAIEALRQGYRGSAIRAAIAHDEIVDPHDFPRFARIDAIPVLSFQWEKPAPDTVDGEKEYLGPARYRYIEPAAFLADAGARIAFGSDWPVDPLNEWFALKVGVTRTNAPDAGAKYRGHLGEDRGLTRAQVLRAITENSSYELHQDRETGSLEVGKLADFIVLDRNVMRIPAEDIANVRVLETVVGGRLVYRAPH
jgi:predicted amidohydrolase YtcJ